MVLSMPDLVVGAGAAGHFLLQGFEFVMESPALRTPSHLQRV
jgi:hypothetical protein